MAYFDKYGVEFSDDRKALVKCPINYEGEYIIPDDVVEICADSFFGCENITSVVFPPSVIKIGSRAFQYCSFLKNVQLSEGLIDIGFCAFSDCVILDKIDIPHGVEKIGDYAFWNCSKLTSIFIPKSTIHIEETTFIGCTSLHSINVDLNNIIYCSIEGVLFSKFGHALYLIKCPAQRTGEYVVPNHVRRIGLFAFDDCLKISSMVFPNSVLDICESALRGCENLKEIVVPRGQKNRFAIMPELKKYSDCIRERD